MEIKITNGILMKKVLKKMSRNTIKIWGETFKMKYEYMGEIYNTIEEVDEAITNYEGSNYNNCLPEYVFEYAWNYDVDIIIEGLEQ